MQYIIFTLFSQQTKAYRIDDRSVGLLLTLFSCHWFCKLLLGQAITLPSLYLLGSAAGLAGGVGLDARAVQIHHTGSDQIVKETLKHTAFAPFFRLLEIALPDLWYYHTRNKKEMQAAEFMNLA